MICVYPSDCTDFASNGMAVLTPSSCTVTETLNGEWELTMVHPLDDRGKWRYLQNGHLLRAPVPAATTPRVEMIQQTQGQDVYTISTQSGKLNLRSGPGTNYKRLGQYAKGKEVILIAKTNDNWYEVTAPDGKHGYMSADYLTFARTEGSTSVATGQVVDSGQLRDQPFRIYRVVPTLTAITVYARHIFYDLMDNMILSYTPAGTVGGATAAQAVLEQCASPHDFTMYSDLTGTADGISFEHINPVEAILGENGIISKYHAELARDWYDVYLVNRVGRDTDVQIRQGKNLLGISYDVDESGVVTRIVPTGEDADGNELYLPETYIDSDNISAYAHIKWGHLAVSDATEDEANSKASVYEKLRKATQDEFANGCDLPKVTLDVNFLNIDDTVEYADFGILHSIFLGDAVQVVVPTLGLTVSLRMTQYTYDCLLKRYTACTLGSVADTLESTTVSSSQLSNGSISGTKLQMNTIGTGQLQSGSVGSLQVKTAAIGSAHIQQAAINEAHLQKATVESLTAQSLTAVSARIQELAAQHLSTDELYAALATIAVAQITAANIEKANINWAGIVTLSAQIADIAKAQITTANITQANIDWAAITELNTEIARIAQAQITAANIETANIDWASIKDLNASVAKIALAQLTTANINSAEIDWASITQLQADIATLVNADIKTADIDWAQIKDLTAGTAIIEKGMNGKLYVADLAVTEANMASLTVGELVVKGTDGCFYSVSVTADGTVATEKKNIEDTDISDNSVSGSKLIEKTITARELNVASIFADEALVGAITAANIDVSSLFAAEAFISNLNATDISGNSSLRLMVDTAKDEALDAAGEAVAQIALTAEQIRSEVKRDYATADQVTQMSDTLSTLAEQSESNFTWTVTKVNEIIEDAAANNTLTREQLDLIHTYMRFGEDGLTIGKEGNPLTFRVVNDRLAFYMNDTEVAYLSNNKLYVTQAEILARLQIGKFAYEPQQNGNLSMIYTG